MSLFRRKSIAALQAEVQSDHSLKRALGPLNLTTLGIGAIIGAGIFVLTGQAAAKFAGPAIVISYILAGLACVFAGLCYAEFAAMIPMSGSAYTYGYATMGELIAWVIGWDLILEYLFAAGTVAVSWSEYAVSILEDLGVKLPAALTSAPYNHIAPTDTKFNIWRLFSEGWVHTGAILNVPAMAIVVIITVLLVLGIKDSAIFNNIAVGIKLAVVLAFIIAGVSYVNVHNWHPFIPAEIEPGHYGWSGILRGAGVIFFAYIGFDAVSTAAQEAKRPQRDMPIGMLASLGICTVLYIAVSLVLTGLIKYTELNVKAPIAAAIDSVGQPLMWLRPIIRVGALAGLSSVILVMMLGQPRIFYTMSKDGLLPPIFSAVHPRFQTPWVATILTGVVAMMIAGLFPIGLLGELVSIGTLLAFAIVCAGVLILRIKSPETPRPFRTPAVWVVAPLGVFFCGWLMYNLPPDTWARLIVWMAIGFVVYFTYGRSHSKVQQSSLAAPDGTRQA